MAKKSFVGGIDALISGTSAGGSSFAEEVQNNPFTSHTKTAEDNQLVRANFVMNPRLHKELKQVALNEGKKLKDVLAEAIEMYLASKQS